MLHAASVHSSNRRFQPMLTIDSEIGSGGKAVDEATLTVKEGALFVLGVAVLLVALATSAFAQNREYANEIPGPANVLVSNSPDVTSSAFDRSILPPIESIDAQTDITVFLESRVPDELRLPALRRAWVVNPAIRDFKGLQEMDMNFNDPKSIPGFGAEIGPGLDVKTYLARLHGGTPRSASSAPDARRPRILNALFDSRR